MLTNDLPNVKSMCECGVDPKCAEGLRAGDDPAKCGVKKPCDNHCLLMKFDGVYQGSFRCVPRMNPDDPKYAGRMYDHIDGSKAKHKSFHSYNMGTRETSREIKDNIEPGEKLGLTHKQQITQKFFLQWQRPAQPFGGKFVGFRLSNAPGADESQLNKAYKRTGDYCIDYKSPSPNTRIRCTNGQFHWGVDDSNWMLCAGMDPQAFGGLFIDTVLIPLVRMIPLVGKKLALLFGPSFKKMVSSFAGVVLDGALSNIPFFGSVYMTLSRIINDWVGIDLRNILTQKHPEQLISMHNGIMDYSIDKTQARMRKVYCGGECDKDLVKSLPAGDRCPDSIPVRAAMLTNERAGDLDLVGVLGSKWPGRQEVNIGSTNMEVAYLKSDLCMSLPVCDQRLMKGYIHQNGKNTDCSGNGACVWNGIKGNHCKCDKGFFGTLCDKEGSPKELGDSLVEIGTSGSLPPRQTRKDVAEANTPPHKAHKKFAKEPFCIKCAAEHKGGAGFTSQDCKKCLSGLSGDECPTHGGKDAMFPCNNWVSTNPYPKQLGLDKTTGCDICEKSCGEKLNKEQTRRLLACKKSSMECGTGFAESFQNPSLNVNGAEAVSAVCKEGGRKKQCGEGKYAACATEGGQCVDLVKWTCSSNKHIIDCQVSREFAPVRTTLETDKICGKLLLGQHRKTNNVCNTGIRRNFSCKTNADCPCGGMSMCAMEGGKPKFPRKFALEAMCCNEENKDNKACKDKNFGSSMRKGVPGCKSKVLLDCDKVKMDQIATMSARL